MDVNDWPPCRKHGTDEQVSEAELEGTTATYDVADWRAGLVESRLLAQQMNSAPTPRYACIRMDSQPSIHPLGSIDGHVSNERMG